MGCTLRPGVLLGAYVVLMAGAIQHAGCAVVKPDAGKVGSGGNPTVLNQAQMTATASSYHITPPDAVIQELLSPSISAVLAANGNPYGLPVALQYTMPSLTDQLSQLGIRSLDLDVFADPQGSLFDQSAVLRLAIQPGYLDEPELQQPGFKVLATPDVDYNSTCLTLADCLLEISEWHALNPTHFPLTIWLDLKQNGFQSMIAAAIDVQAVNSQIQQSSAVGPSSLITPLNWTAALVAQLETQLKSAFPANAIVTPAVLQKSAPSLAAALLGTNASPGWPTLEALVGKIIFVIKPDSTPFYLSVYPGLAGSALAFVSEDGAATADSTVFLQIAGGDLPEPSDLTSAATAIDTAARAGYMVRAAVDYQTLEARTLDFTRYHTLMGTGAHYLATDFPVAASELSSTYVADEFPLRCNPITSNSFVDGNSLTPLPGVEAYPTIKTALITCPAAAIAASSPSKAPASAPIELNATTPAIVATPSTPAAPAPAPAQANATNATASAVHKSSAAAGAALSGACLLLAAAMLAA